MHQDFVGSDVSQSRPTNDAKGVRRAHATSKLDFFRTNGLGRLALDEVVPALGFALELQFGETSFPI